MLRWMKTIVEQANEAVLLVSTSPEESGPEYIEIEAADINAKIQPPTTAAPTTQPPTTATPCFRCFSEYLV